MRAIAEALWNIGQGYTVGDVASIGGDGRVDWCSLNADDAADEALHMGHAQRVLEHLTSAGWGDVTATQAEVERLREALRVAADALADEGAAGMAAWCRLVASGPQ